MDFTYICLLYTLQCSSYGVVGAHDATLQGKRFVQVSLRTPFGELVESGLKETGQDRKEHNERMMQNRPCLVVRKIYGAGFEAR